MKKVGILGGTFDPLHIGHLVMADQALYYAELDEIWFIPAPSPPHKQGKEITSIQHRLAMLEKVVKADSKYRLSTIELERKGPSYTIDTVKELITLYPDHHFHFIIGGDMIRYLPKWYKIDELITLIQFIGLQRPGYSIEAESQKAKELYEKVKLYPMPQLEVSSSQIREWTRIGRPIRYVVPAAIENYIKEHRLYED